MTVHSTPVRSPVGRQMRSLRIAVLPGDGIGQEVMPPTLQVLEEVARLEGLAVSWDHLDWGSDRYIDRGHYLEPGELETIRGHDAILLGAVGDPRVPDDTSLWGLLLPIRQQFRQRINLRPVMSFNGIRGPLRSEEPFDLLVVRENNEGEYVGIGGRAFDHDREIAVESSVFTRHGTERVVRAAFEHSRTRRRRLVSATKSNALRYSMTLWDSVVREVAGEYPDVEVRSIHVDALVARLIQRPQEFDVIVGSNLFGDIVADLAAALMGSLGLAPSANVNIDGDAPSMFEPVHGSAPDIYGRGIANPVGQILSAALMFRHLGADSAADRLERAVRAALAAGTARTPDLGGSANTEQAAHAVACCLTSEVAADERIVHRD